MQLCENTRFCVYLEEHGHESIIQHEQYVVPSEAPRQNSLILPRNPFSAPLHDKLQSQSMAQAVTFPLFTLRREAPSQCLIRGI